MRSASPSPARRALLGLAVALALVAGCTGEATDEEPTEAAAVPTATPTPEATAEPTPTPTPSPTRTAEPVDRQILDDEWYVDSNGDGIPDFMAVELGLDPEVDTCLAEVDCPGPGTVDALAEIQENVLLLLDASGSMVGSAGGGVTKMQAAKDALERYVVGTPDTVRIGFGVYGHLGSNRPEGKAESCAGVEILEPIGAVDHETIGPLLDRFEATGWTPLAGAIAAARGAFEDTEEGARNRVIVVSDGIETCEGDPVAEAQALIDSGIDVVIDVVGFDVPDAETAQLREIAAVGGGTYVDARTTDALRDHFENLRQQWLGLLDQAICVLRSSQEMSTCYNRLRSAAFEQFTAASREATSSEERREIIRLSSEMMDHFRQRSAEISAAGRTGHTELSQAARAVRDRMRERYGEDVSGDLRCALRLA
jgi:hypothetical protein